MPDKENKIKNIHIFIRKKSFNFQHSIERFVKNLHDSSMMHSNLTIKIKKCPVSSKGFIKRIYLIFWAFFNQGDVNHITGDISFLSLFLKKKKTINTLLDCRLVYEFKGIKKYLYYLFWFYFPIIKSKYVVFISEFTKQQIIDFSKIKLKNAKIIPIQLEKNISTLRKNNKYFKRILIIGTQKNKNIKMMIKSIIGVNCKLIIVGELEKKIISFLKLHNISFQNFVNISDEKIKKLYQISDILLMVSDYEGFGMPIIEAQKAGLLVITSNKSPMIKTASKYGSILVNTNNSLKLKAILKKIIKNEIKIHPYINYGRYNANKYNDYLIFDQYKKLYLQV